MGQFAELFNMLGLDAGGGGQAPQGQDIRSNLIQQLFEQINAPQDQAPQLPVPESASNSRRLGAALLSLSGDQNALGRLQQGEQSRQQALQQNAVFGARSQQQQGASRASAIQTLLSQTGQDLDRGLRGEGQVIDRERIGATLRGQDKTAATALMKELGTDRRTAEKLAENMRQFGITNAQQVSQFIQKHDINLARLELDKQKFTAAEQARVNADKNRDTAEVRKLVAKFPNAFQGDTLASTALTGGFEGPRGAAPFNSAESSFDEAISIISQSGAAVTGKDIPAFVKSEMADMKTSVAKVTEAMEAFDRLGEPSGYFATLLPSRHHSPATKEMNSILQKAVVTIRRALFGTAFTANERETGLALLPEITASPDEIKFALAALQDLMQSKLDGRIEVFGDPTRAGTGVGIAGPRAEGAQTDGGEF